MTRERCGEKGFTLIELAIVLLIVGLLSKNILEPIAFAQERQRYSKNYSKLRLIKESLLAHVVATGTLPCPTSTNTRSGANPSFVCNVGQGGIPAATLGIAGAVSEQGALLDEWGRAYIYVVSLSSHPSEGEEHLPDWTTADEASVVGIANLRGSLALCLQAAAVSCPLNQVRANELAFVVVSNGQNISQSALEAENTDGDNIFVVAEYSIEQTTAFDDQVVWSSAQEVMYWMLRAAWLP